MESHRSSQRVGRRRRVLADELRSDSAATHRIFRGHDADVPPNRYTESALQSMQASMTDCLPLRRFNLAVWFLTGLMPFAGLVALDRHQSVWSKVLGKSYLHAFDVTASSNLAAWLSSTVFALAALVMWGIYSVRKHRRDDYRARFTVWLWAIAAAVFLSMDASAGLHHAWQGCCQYLFETPLRGDGSIWWVGTWSLVFGSLWIRLMLEMRRSRISTAWAAGASCLYFAGALIHLDLTPQLVERFGPSVQTNTVLLAHHCVIFTLISYARHVVLEALGRIDAHAKPNREEGSTQRKTDQTESNPTGANSRPVLRTVTAADCTNTSGEESDSSNLAKAAHSSERSEVHAFGPPAGESKNGADESDMRGLSKADRKRLRKEKRKRRAA